MTAQFVHPCRWSLSMILVALISGCSDPADKLQGQVNVQLIYYALVVDQDGQPMPDVMFSYRLEAYPRDWTFDTRGRDYEPTFHRAKSDANGRFQLQLDGCILRLQKVSIPEGYRHFFEEDTGDYGPQNAPPKTSSVGLISWGQQLYKSDPDRPAIFVFVKDGVKEVSALPSRGGYEAYGQQWIPNEPTWPRRPSLKDVVYVPPATQPSTQPAGKE